jgi:exodeoxyribonuclease V gamma subunit
VQAHTVIADLRAGLGDGVAGPLLVLSDVRALVADRLAGRPTRAGFRTGALTVCSLEPMRAVPHRVVCLLGMDDGVFPRAAARDGDDVLLRNPCLGERDRRGEDRQLFLDAVTAATDHLIVLYSGADERTGAPRPPSVPVAELLDVLDGVVPAMPHRPPLRERLVVRHPLQPADRRNFEPGTLGRTGPFSFDPHAHRAALAAARPRRPVPAFLPVPLPVEPQPDVVELDDLVALLEHPARWFARTRLEVTPVGETAEVVDRLPLEADPLTRWAIGDRLLAARSAGADAARARAAEWRRGEVPPRYLGAAVLDSVAGSVSPLLAAAAPWLVPPADVLDVDADLPSGLSVLGSVAAVHRSPGRPTPDPTVVRVVFSRLSAKHRIRAWVQVLALAAARPGPAWQAVTIGRAPGTRALAAVSVLHAPPQAVAAQRLDDLVRLRRRATRAPLPLPVTAAFAYAQARAAAGPEPAALEDARRAWADAHEAEDPYNRLCWGEDGGFDALLGAPESTEQAWFPETTRFGVLARRVWEPLLAAEERWTV